MAPNSSIRANPLRADERLACDERAPPQVERLRDEHANIAQLLLVLDSHFVRLHEDGAVDGALLLKAVSYVLEYIDRRHHTREDLVVGLLATREPLVRALLSTLTTQLSTIHTLGAELRTRLGSGPEDDVVARRQLARQGFAFSAELRRNIALEEVVIFPIASLELSAAEWATIDEEIEASAGLLFSCDDEHYRALFEELTERVGCSCKYA
jgi:hemerythrin-like domain-containing protein